MLSAEGLVLLDSLHNVFIISILYWKDLTESSILFHISETNMASLHLMNTTL